MDDSVGQNEQDSVGIRLNAHLRLCVRLHLPYDFGEVGGPRKLDFLEAAIVNLKNPLYPLYLYLACVQRAGEDMAHSLAWYGLGSEPIDGYHVVSIVL